MIVYAFVAHWVWAKDGWLAKLGAESLKNQRRFLFFLRQLCCLGYCTNKQELKVCCALFLPKVLFSTLKDHDR